MGGRAGEVSPEWHSEKPRLAGNPEALERLQLTHRVYRGRNIVEWTIGHLRENRRIGTRFEKLATSFLGMLKLAFLRRYLALIDPSDTA